LTRIVNRYSGNTVVRRRSCAEQFRVTAFAQLTWRESLRDNEVTLGANSNKQWDCVTGFAAPPGSMPTIREIGVPGPICRPRSFGVPAGSTSRTILDSI